MPIREDRLARRCLKAPKYITGLIKLASVPKQPKLPGLFGKAGVALRAFPARRAYTCKDQIRGRWKCFTKGLWNSLISDVVSNFPPSHVDSPQGLVPALRRSLSRKVDGSTWVHWDLYCHQGKRPPWQANLRWEFWLQTLPGIPASVFAPVNGLLQWTSHCSPGFTEVQAVTSWSRTPKTDMWVQLCKRRFNTSFRMNFQQPPKKGRLLLPLDSDSDSPKSYDKTKTCRDIPRSSDDHTLQQLTQCGPPVDRQES